MNRERRAKNEIITTQNEVNLESADLIANVNNNLINDSDANLQNCKLRSRQSTRHNIISRINNNLSVIKSGLNDDDD